MPWSTEDSTFGRSIEERLTRLKDLYDKGLITKDDYDKKRGEILGAL